MRQIGHGRLHDPDYVQPGRINVNVSIDQSWHQDTATAVDDLVFAEWGALGNLANTTVFHDNVSTRSQRFRFAVEDASRPKDNSRLHF